MITSVKARGLVAALAVCLLMPLRGVGADPLIEAMHHAPASADGYDIYEIESTISKLPLGPVEGVWQMTTHDGIFSIILNRVTSYYEIRAVDMPDRNIAPGTLIGIASPTARQGYYDAQMMTRSNTGLMSKPKRFTFCLDDVGRLIIRPAGKVVKFNLWKFLPYLFRNMVRIENNRDDNLDGALRIIPEADTSAETTIYL